MIKLTKSQPAPVSLSSETCRKTLNTIQLKIANGEEVVASDYKSLYGLADVRDRLKHDQNYKCAYCEKTIVHEQNHVEHYRPKKKYPTLAFTWENLLGCCWKCNNTKHNHFPLADETKRNTSQEEPLIINPYVDDPADYIAFHEEYATPKKGLSSTDKEKAETTIRMLLSHPDLENRRREAWANYCKQREYHESIMALLGTDPIGMSDFYTDIREFSGMFRYQQ